jgi:phosphate ABC transporter membrane protein
LTGIIVGLSRAIGETAPLITIGALTFITFLPIAMKPLLVFQVDLVAVYGDANSDV